MLAENVQYVGAQVALAQADSNVMVINARRLTEDLGWNPTSGQSDQFLEDGVHYTALGAKVLASAVAAAMLGEIHVSSCPSDPGAVSLQSSMTLVVELGGTSACTNYGRMSVAQALTLNHPVLRVVLTNGFVPAAGDSFQPGTGGGGGASSDLLSLLALAIMMRSGRCATVAAFRQFPHTL